MSSKNVRECTKKERRSFNSAILDRVLKISEDTNQFRIQQLELIKDLVKTQDRMALFLENHHEKVMDKLDDVEDAIEDKHRKH